MEETISTTISPDRLLQSVSATLGGLIVFVACYFIYAAAVLNRRNAAAVAYSKRTTTTSEGSGHTNLGALVIAMFLLLLGYSYTIACMEGSIQKQVHRQFSPRAILGIPEADFEAISSNTAALKLLFRDLSKQHHPDVAGGDAKKYRQIVLAYQALTDDKAKRNMQLHGHPEGPLETPMFLLTLPKYMVTPVQAHVHGIYAALMALLIGLIAMQEYTAYQEKKKLSKSKSLSLLDQSNSVSVEDLAYLTEHLLLSSSSSSSTVSPHVHILWTVLTCPESIAWSMQDVERVQQAHEERKKQDKNAGNSSKQQQTFDDLLNSDGWDNENDEDSDKNDKAAQAEAQKQADLERMKEATGQAIQLLEGVDDGVLGQKWVEQTLEKAGVWPPKDFMQLANSFQIDGKHVSVLDHPGLRRMLCMTTGRLNSQMLNSHPDLLEAGAQKRIDQTYFKASMEFRQRVGMFLEAALRVAMATKNSKLVNTIIETVAMFKIGCHHDKVDWFKGVMQRQYECLPQLKIENEKVINPNENEIVTGDKVELQLSLERLHTGPFTKAKVLMAQKQGIPPQIALQAYQEGWWFLIRSERLDGKTQDSKIDRSIPIFGNVDPSVLDRYDQVDPEYKLIKAWPLIVRNVALQSCTVKIELEAPSVPGKYRFHVDVKSQDFLGADKEFSVDAEVLDASKVTRTPKTEEVVEEKDATGELKKEK